MRVERGKDWIRKWETKNRDCQRDLEKNYANDEGNRLIPLDYQYQVYYFLNNYIVIIFYFLYYT